MAESLENSVDNSVDNSATKAPKDKACPYCGQSFTSSSLGRHLDLYIKEKNPKAPDGIHDVAAIRKLRGNITRRQAKGSLARRDTSTPAGTPTATSRRSPQSDADDSMVKSPTQPKESQNLAELTAHLSPFIPRWEATGVINDIPAKGGESSRVREGDVGQDPARRLLQTRAVSRQMVKVQHGMKQKVQDAVDTARAAELALREMISSWRAAKQHIDMTSMPFDFDPLSMDFPALTLQCLQPPPTLFSSTQHSTPTSWSISPPGARQNEALKSFFAEEFRKWKMSCAAATTAVMEELTYPPSATPAQHDVRDAVQRAEKLAESLERQVSEHIRSAFSVWESLSPQRRTELWTLELARSGGRRQNELDKMKETQHTLKQENANLKSQIEHLNRLQQPREFKMFSPATVPLNEGMLKYMLEEAVERGRKGVGLNLDDRHSDLNTIVTTAIDRWKKVIVSARSAGGMNAQRPLDQSPVPNSASAVPSGISNINNPPVATPPPAPLHLQQQSVPTLQQPPPPRHPPAATVTAAKKPMSHLAASPVRLQPAPAQSSAAASEDDSMSDQDADAEMEDDDGYAEMNTPISKPLPPAIPQQQTPQLDVPRTRGPVQRMAAKSPFAMNGNRYASHAEQTTRAQVNMNRSMTNMDTSMYGHNQEHHSKMGIQMQGKDDPMYMD